MSSTAVIPTNPSRIVSMGSQKYILTNQEPKEDTPLPVNDSAWVSLKPREGNTSNK